MPSVTRAKAWAKFAALLARSLKEGQREARKAQRRKDAPPQNRNLIRRLDRALSPIGKRFYK